MADSEPTKKCRTCGENKPLTAANPEAEIAKVKEWQAANREKVLAAQKAYRSENSEQRKESFRRWCADNPDYFRRYAQQYARDHADHVREYRKAYYAAKRSHLLAEAKRKRAENTEAARRADREKYAANFVRRSESARRWRQNHPETVRAVLRNVRARRRAVEGTHTAADVAAIRTAQNGRCAGCAKPLDDKYTVDHVMPIALGGTNWSDNLQLLCRRCNSRKHAKHPDEWAKEIGKLFT